jgi:hypothetical protein
MLDLLKFLNESEKAEFVKKYTIGLVKKEFETKTFTERVDKMNKTIPHPFLLNNAIIAVTSDPNNISKLANFYKIFLKNNSRNKYLLGAGLTLVLSYTIYNYSCGWWKYLKSKWNNNGGLK